MTHVVLSLGSNIDRETNIRTALDKVQSRLGDLELSPVYETVAVGFEGPPFLNLVAGFDTDLPLLEVRDQLRQIEIESGRVRGNKTFDNRILDIDIILFGDQDFRPQGFNIPRDEIEKFAYVLKPLSDLYPNQFHPVTGKRYIDMWHAFDSSAQPVEVVEF